MWFLLIQLLQSSSALEVYPVFTFNDTFYPAEPPSFASLTRKVELPDSFILCSSSKQVRFDDQGAYFVLGEDGSHWLSVSFEHYHPTFIIWFLWDKGWYKLGHINSAKLNYWYHVCLEFDQSTSKIETAVNGKLLESVVGRNDTVFPNVFNMVIGKSKNFKLSEEQFQGSVTKIELFTNSEKHNITALTSKPCELKGDLLAWHPEDWRVEGERWLLVEETGDSVCDQGENYVLAIPVEMGIHEAMDICTKKLKNTTMPYKDEKASLETYASWYDNITSGSCQNLWTPFSDETSEGSFFHINDGTEAKYLPWDVAQPNGETNENYVCIILQTSRYKDVTLDQQYCSSCLLDRSLLLRMDGLCEDSYIGDPLKAFQTLTVVSRLLFYNCEHPSKNWFQWLEKHLHQVKHVLADIRIQFKLSFSKFL